MSEQGLDFRCDVLKFLIIFVSKSISYRQKNPCLRSIDNAYLGRTPNLSSGENMSQYDLDVIVQKIQDRSPFELKDNNRSRQRVLKIIISKLYRSLDYKNEPRACREKVTQLLLFQGQFGKEEIDEIFKKAVQRSTEYSKEFLEQYPELARELSEGRTGEKKSGEKEVPEEIIYRFQNYA